MPEHFVAPPEWGGYIVAYFFLGGIAGGAYALGALLRLLGGDQERPLARLAFLISFPALVLCPVLLTLDLGRPLRFWHMLVDARTWGASFKYWSPMSVGAWALAVFGIFSLASFLDALLRKRPLGGGLSSPGFTTVGAVIGLFVAGYTGVLLSVSNQPVWSDTWALGGLFLASALSASAAAIALLAAASGEASVGLGRLAQADRYFIVLELLLLIAFFLSLGSASGMVLRGPWLGFWVVVLAGTLVPLVLHSRSTSPGGRAAVAGGLVLAGSLALRIVIVYAAQS